MHPQRLIFGRLPILLRSFRHTTTIESPSKTRLFTQNSQLLLVSHVSPRPQLPFLTPPSRRHVLRSPGFPWQLSRLITTERKQYIKEQFWLAGKYTIYGWTGFFLLLVVGFGIQNESLERKYPTPRTWSFVSRWTFRNAKGQEEPDPNGNGLVDWADTGDLYRHLLERLEDPAIDGSELSEQQEGGILVPGVGKTGFNVEGKTNEWRRGYHETLMGAAKAAEHLDGWVKDDTRNVAFPREVVIGPSNPDPRPVPPGAKSPPLEENCSPAFPPPETYYMKILTTKGFTTKDRIDAALAYADWLDYKNLPDSAEEIHRWALDISNSTLPSASSVVDSSSGIIRSDTANISSNLLMATTSLAIHHARNNNTASALPIFLSILRARRALPTPPASLLKFSEIEEKPPSNLSYLLSLARDLIVPPPYPSPLPSGNETPYRTSAELCEEASIMTYIGEVLFASSSHNDGLSWTREAVDLAEERFADPDTDQQGRVRCQECLDVSLDNWKKMVAKLARDERKQKDAAKPGWFGSNARLQGEGRWLKEERVVEERMKRAKEILNEQRLTKSVTEKGAALLFG